MSTTAGGGAMGPLNIVVNVGILSFVSDADRERGLKPDFTVNVHFSMELGDDWTVQLDYSKLKYLDVELSTSSVAKKLTTTPFPLIDKHLYHIFRECCAQRNTTYDTQQQVFIANFITGKLERWIQMLIQRFHSFPRDIKYLLNRAFGIFPSSQIGNMTGGGGSDAFTTNASDGGNSSSNGSGNNGGSGGGDGGGGGFFNYMFRPKSAPASPLTSDNIQNVATGSNVKHHRADDVGSVGSGKSGSSASSALKKMMNFGSDRNVNGAGERRISSAFDAEDILIAQKPPLAIAVKRGTKDEGRHNRVHYEISINSDLVGPDGKLMYTPLVVQKRYNDFKQLWKDLQEKNVYNLDRIHTCDATNYRNYLFLLSKFPLPPMTLRNGFGSSLSEEELQSRSRHLDMWIREVCFSYYLMPNQDAKNLVKQFFNLRPKIATDRDTIFLHQFTNGIVEGSRADIAALRMLHFKTGSLHSGGSAHSEKQSDKGHTTGHTKTTGAPPTALNRIASNKSIGKASSVTSAQSNNDNISEYGAPSVTGSEIAVYTGKDKLGRKDQDTTVYYNHHEVINRTEVFKNLQVGSVKFLVSNSRSSWTFPYFLAFDHKRFNDQNIWTRFREKIFSSEIVDKLKGQEQKASSIGQENSYNNANMGNYDKKSAGRRGSGIGGGGGAKALAVDPYQSLTPIEERDSKVDFDAEPSEISGSDGSLEDAKELARRELNNRYLNIGMK